VNFTDRLRDSVLQLLEYIPALIGALVILFAGYLLAKLLEKGTYRLLRRVRLNEMLERGGVLHAVERSGAHFNPVRIIANLVLDGMQKTIAQAVPRKGSKVHFVRYADDFIVTSASKELLEQQVKPALTAFLTPRGLELSEQKTVITHIHQGFNFLGHTLRKFGNKLLTTPAKSSVQGLRDKIRLCVKSALALPQAVLLGQLNRLLRGWTNYYRHGAAKRTFKSLDSFLFWQLWRWATRRHPCKSATWKRRTYFSAAKGIFSVRLPKDKHKSRVLSVYQAASTKIQRHIKIRGAANPYDPDYSGYFETRLHQRRWHPSKATAVTAQTQNATRSIAHWLQDAAACPYHRAPVREA